MVAGHLQVKKGIFYIVLNYYDADGKRKQQWISTKLKVRGNKKNAEKMLADAKRDFTPPTEVKAITDISLDMSFTDYLKYWLDIKKDSITITTYSSYKTMIYKIIGPYFERKGLKISEIKPSDIQSFYNTQAKRVTAATVSRYHNVIHSAYKYLMRLDLIQSNPADRVILPKRQKYVGDFYNEEDLNRLFEITKNHPLGLLIQVTACYGLRRSEVIGLKWDAVDFEADTLTIRHIVTSVKLDGKTTITREDRAKTKSSLRTLPLLGDIKRQLLELQEHQEENKQLCKASYNHEYDEYIFVDDTGNLFRPDYVTNAFRTILEQNDLKMIRFHDLRHSCASLLLSHDVPMKLIQEWLGHSDIGTTANIYSHTDYKAKLFSANVMEDSLKFRKPD